MPFSVSFSWSELLEPEYLHYEELHSPCSVASETGFYEIFKEEPH